MRAGHFAGLAAGVAVLGVAGWWGVPAAIDAGRPVAAQAVTPSVLDDQPPVDCADNGTGHDGFNPDKQLFFGELHLHTGYSLDAFSFGTRTTPAEAYLFAKGNGAQVEINTGTSGAPGPDITLQDPLDFVAITDHSEFLSVVQGCVDHDSPFYNSPSCEQVRSRDPEIQKTIFPRMGDILTTMCAGFPNRFACVAQQRSAWAQIQADAREANDKCHFTSFVGFEWSDQAMENGEATNHRNVIFGSARVPVAPLSSAQYTTPPQLWNALERECTGDCHAVTIPHNTNLSGGVSLRVWNWSPRSLRLQQKYQVSAEIYQHKGASECLYDPATGYAETDCQFEQLVASKVEAGVVPQSYLRDALGRGLAASLAGPAFNVFRLGFVAGTDGHNGAPGNVDEADWHGHDAGRDNTPFRRLTDRPDWGPGGLTGVWAEENSREALFAAILRRETYATSGPRLRVRVHRTDDLSACTNPGYPGAILPTATPMGGTFQRTALNGAAGPSFVIEAWPDAREQSLATAVTGDRRVAGIAAVQVIKIRAHAGRRAPVVITDTPIDATDGAGFNPEGGCVVWTDQDFDPAEAALYYVRVLQEPTWRWTHHDCLALAADPETRDEFVQAGCSDGTIPQAPVQERAWTSPIWYEPTAPARQR